MKLSEIKGEYYQKLDGKKNYLPLFNNKELEKAEPIIKALEGMTINSAKELLNKVSIAIEQLAIVR